MTKEVWEKIKGFGRCSHIVESNGTTLCGKDVSYRLKFLQNNPPRKCLKCLTISKVYDKIKEHQKQDIIIETH